MGLSTGDSDAMFSTSKSGGNNVRHGIYEFSLATVPVGVTITSATLKLTTSRFISNTGGNPGEISVYGYTGDGLITTADYGIDPNPASTTSFGSFPSELVGNGGTPSGSILEFDFSEFSTITTANASGSDIFGLRTQTISFVDFQVAAIEHATLTAPTLEITYVPEPSSALLVALGALAGLGRRKR
ncbi:MAG: PEP-CTERM sorting domain-containing protein [Akkermansiaceae bacterium]